MTLSRFSELMTAAKMYGIPLEDSPPIEIFLDEGDKVKFGNSELDVLFTPGHSPASICFYDKHDGFVVCGDTLFAGSIGRTDLPGGHTETLMQSIKNKLLTLPDETKLYPGHMGSTTVGQERVSNPFVLAYERGELGQVM